MPFAASAARPSPIFRMPGLSEGPLVLDGSTFIGMSGADLVASSFSCLGCSGAGIS